MVKEEIVEGLKYAIAKGETLPNAMMSFYNAGYLKQDIEEAARALQTFQPQIQPAQPIQPIQQPPQQQAYQPRQQPLKPQAYQPKQQAYQLGQQPCQPPVVIQRVSAYEKTSSRGNLLVILLAFILVILFGILVAVFLFKDKLAQFLGNIL